MELAVEKYKVENEPFYLPVNKEIELFEAAYEAKLPAMLKGPTGCGKTRFVEYMAYKLNRPLITVACHEDLSSMSKSAVEKKALAGWIGGNTLAPSKWIAVSLSMGHPSSVTQAKAWCRDSKDGKKWLGKLE